jgi:23S rRNA (guanosine2251-2'-O)-methyltransferase
MRKLTHDEISRQRFSPQSIRQAERMPVYALLDNIRSLYNVGSIFRTADGARAAGLYLCGYTPHPPRKEIDKTALGATATVPWEYYRDPLDAIAHLKSRGVRICALEHTDRSIPYTELTPDMFPLCLVVGNEITGVSPGILSETDCAIEIPMLGTKQSLNAAVAFGIAVFDCVRVLRPGGNH